MRCICHLPSISTKKEKNQWIFPLFWDNACLTADLSYHLYFMKPPKLLDIYLIRILFHMFYLSSNKVLMTNKIYEHTILLLLDISYKPNPIRTICSLYSNNRTCEPFEKNRWNIDKNSNKSKKKLKKLCKL